jgi:hypothetical protein
MKWIKNLWFPPLNFALEYAIRKVPQNQKTMQLNGAHQFGGYADGNLQQGKT